MELFYRQKIKYCLFGFKGNSQKNMYELTDTLTLMVFQDTKIFVQGDWFVSFYCLIYVLQVILLLLNHLPVI